jgi:NACHT domain
MVYFFFDFKDASKQDIRALQTSLLVQLCRQSEVCFKALFDLYSTHDQGKQQPSETVLSHCLKSMFRVLGQVPIYLIIDALDECPNISKSIGVPQSRQKVLRFLKELVELQLPNLYTCVTSRHEFDIRNSLEQFARLKLSLHDQDGQKQDIAEYVRSVIHSDNELVMKKWRQAFKDLVIKTLSEKADGMYGCPFMLVARSHADNQVSMGCMSAANAEGLSCTQCRACPERVARIAGRDVSTCSEGNQGHKSRGCLSPFPMSRSGHQTTSR